MTNGPGPRVPRTQAVQPVDFLQSYLNRADLLHDLSETTRQLSEAMADTHSVTFSVRTITPRFRQARASDRLSETDTQALISAFVTGMPRRQLAEQYKISLRTVGRLLQKHGVRKRHPRAE
jgi:FixJ family two-component response regulator